MTHLLLTKWHRIRALQDLDLIKAEKMPLVLIMLHVPMTETRHSFLGPRVPDVVSLVLQKRAGTVIQHHTHTHISQSGHIDLKFSSSHLKEHCVMRCLPEGNVYTCPLDVHRPHAAVRSLLPERRVLGLVPPPTALLLCH